MKIFTVVLWAPVWLPMLLAAQERIPLWDAADQTDDRYGYVTVYKPEKPNGAALVICPGGGYGGLVMRGEGTGIAQWLNSSGITGIVLAYHLPEGHPEVPLRDVQRALRLSRARAEAWGIQPDRIGIIGFSAGGHLAATASTRFDSGDPLAQDPVERLSCRPDFAVLIYPVISMGPLGHSGSRTHLLGEMPDDALIRAYSMEYQVTPTTPPTFLAHARDDRTVPCEHSLLYAEALKRNGVATKYLELPSGGHGLNGYKGPMWEAWQTQSLEWLRAQTRIP